MPEKIQSYPQGILEILGVKSLGITPSILPDTCQAVLEMADLYGSLKWAMRRDNFAVGAIEGAGVITTVPDNELWWLKSVEMSQTQSAAITQLAHSIRLRPLGAEFNSQVAYREYVTFKTGVESILAWQPSTPWLLPSGSTLEGRIEIMTGGAGGAFEIRSVFYRFQRT